MGGEELIEEAYEAMKIQIKYMDKQWKLNKEGPCMKFISEIYKHTKITSIEDWIWIQEDSVSDETDLD